MTPQLPASPAGQAPAGGHPPASPAGVPDTNWAAVWLIADFMVATGTPLPRDGRGGKR